MEDLRKRTDSLSPPYPAFDEHIRAMLADGWNAKEIAALFRHQGRPLREQVVHDWASGNPPSGNLHGDIKKHLDYDFSERVFAVAAAEAGFSPAEGPDELRAIRTCASLRSFLAEFGAVVRVEAIKELAGHKSASSLGNFINNKAGLSHPLMVSLLKAMPAVVRQSKGEELGPATPVSVLAQIAKDCRLASGLGRPEFAKRLGVDAGYLRYLEENLARVEREKDERRGKGGTSNPERYAKLCRVLAKERARLGADSGDNGEPATEASASEPVEIPILRRREETAAEEVSPVEADVLRSELRRLSLEVAELRRQMAEALAQVKPSDDGYRNPFEGRGQTHGFRPDGTRLRLVGIATKLLTEELGLLAGIEDPVLKQRVRLELTQALQELFAAIEIFQQKNPFSPTIAKLIEGWRRGFDAELGRTSDQ